MYYTGQPMKRVEDPHLVTGKGSFVDDVQLPDMLHAAILRSPHAHARIRAIDAAAARSMPGVVAVLTGATVSAQGVFALHPGEDLARLTRRRRRLTRCRNCSPSIASW